MSRGPKRRNVAVVTGCLVAMFITAPGQTFVVSTFNEALTGALGISPTRLATAYLIGTLMSAACLTSVGKVADRIGPRRMIALASIGLALAGLALSSVSGFVSLTFAFFLLRVFGQGAIPLASSHALALRYEANLGAVEGLRGATVSAAVAIAPQLSVALIAGYGWRFAASAMAVGAGVVGLLAAVLLIDPDPPRGARPGSRAAEGPQGDASLTLAEARRTLPFWILLVSLAVLAGVLTAVHFHLLPILETAGMTNVAAAQTFASFAAAGLASTVIGGVLADRMSPGVLLGVAMSLLAAGTIVIASATGSTSAHVGMATHGVAHGLATATIAPTLARYFGRAHHGAIRGMSGAVGVAGSAFGPLALSAVADAGGGFDVALFIMGLSTAAVAAGAFALRRPRVPPSRGVGAAI